MAWSGMQQRILDRLTEARDELGQLSAIEAYNRRVAIATDEFLAQIVREGCVDRGRVLREAGYTALAEALGL